ncbi:hypothetical protein COP2_015078 [Malus domestica]
MNLLFLWPKKRKKINLLFFHFNRTEVSCFTPFAKIKMKTQGNNTISSRKVCELNGLYRAVVFVRQGSSSS